MKGKDLIVERVEKMKILIVDDHEQIISILEGYAKKEGYTPIIALDGADAMQKFREEKPDLLLLDVMMPKKDGFAVCREIRRISNVPIIMITARGEDFERIMGLEIGADDYIIKPFSPGEVMARIKAIMRRIHRMEPQEKQIFEVEDLRINLEEYTVAIGEKYVALTKKEIEILWILVSTQDKVFSRDSILDLLWGEDYFGDTRTVDTHIKRLRAKLGAYNHPTWEIKTIWGVGYKFEVKNNV